MRVNVAELAASGGLLERNYQPGELDFGAEEVSLVGPLRLEARLALTDKGFNVSGHVRCQIETSCDRCACPDRIKLEPAFNLFYVNEEAFNELEAGELLPEDLNFSAYDGEVLDVDELVREQVLLAIPSHPLCSSDCRGLCSGCGRNLNKLQCRCEQNETDPRWALLASMKDQ